MKSKIKGMFKNSIFTFVLGVIVFGVVGTLAATLIYSKDVTYDNASSGSSSTTVQGALDELYAKAKDTPSCDSDGICTVSCKTGEQLILKSNNSYQCVVSAGKTIISRENIVTSGDGLYADTVTDGRYIYRGSSVNNYITFNNETWRIISIESDGTLKIVRNEQLSGTYQWDALNNRSSSTSTYCSYASSYGCNAWAATSNLVGTPSSFTQYYPKGNTNDSTNYTGTVTSDSTMATYLNGTYYNSLSSDAKSKVIKGTFNVSTPGYLKDTETLETDAEQEKQYQWKGYVALYTVTELLRASTTSGCSSLSAGYNSKSTDYCNSNNWLWPTTFNSSNFEWTLSPYVSSNRYIVWYVSSSAYVKDCSANLARGVRPVLHLSSNMTLSGSGTSSEPYTIKNS